MVVFWLQRFDIRETGVVIFTSQECRHGFGQVFEDIFVCAIVGGQNVNRQNLRRDCSRNLLENNNTPESCLLDCAWAMRQSSKQGGNKL